MRQNRYGGLILTAVFILISGSTVLAQLPGDLDANGEVNLADLVDFVGCLDGPDGIAVNPACDPTDFDSDTDIDLRDFAGFQARFGFGQGPPQIVSFTPASGEWVVDDIGLTEVKIGFSEPVIVPTDPTEAIDVWGLVSGTVTGFATSYDPATFELTVTFAAPLRDDQVTVVVDYTIEDVAGNPLDGEILNPKNAALPSGNNINGGQGVFRIRVLQGDANRDGVVDTMDLILINESYDFCEGDIHFDPNADLNNDGCVDATDNFIVDAAFGNLLPVTDNVPPILTGIREPMVDQQDFDRIIIDFSEIVSDPRITVHTCFLVDGNGNVVVPTTAVGGPFGRTAIYNFVNSLARCDTYTINVSNAISDFSGELLVASGPLAYP